jgi:hypothetical protein
LEITDLYKGVTRLDEEPDDYIVREMIPCNGGEEEEKEKSAGTGLQKIQSPVSPLSTPFDARIFHHSCCSCFTFFPSLPMEEFNAGFYKSFLLFFQSDIYSVQWLCGPLIEGCIFFSLSQQDKTMKELPSEMELARAQA